MPIRVEPDEEDRGDNTCTVPILGDHPEQYKG